METTGPVAAIAALLWSLGAAAPTTLLAQDGTLDPTFGEHGLVVHPLSFGEDSPAEVLIRENGRILVAGSGGDGSRFVLLQLLPNGALDTSFGDHGVVETTLGFPQYLHSALLLDGDLLVVGTAGLNGILARYLEDGALDESWGDHGIVTVSRENNYVVFSAVRPSWDDALLVAGYFYPSPTTLFVARFLEDGSPDSAFGQDGMARYEIGPFASAQTYSVAEQQQGRLVIGAWAQAYPEESVFVGFDSGGSLDPLFGQAGVATVDWFPGTESPYRLEVDAENRLVVSGSAVAGDTPQGFVGVLDVAGTPDPGFGQGGVVPLGSSGLNGVAGLALDPAGRVLATGPRAEDFGVVRLLPSGLLDPTFGDQGVATVDFGSYDTPADLAIQGDGRIVVAGQTRLETPGDFAVARLKGSRDAPAAPVPALSGGALIVLAAALALAGALSVSRSRRVPQ